MQLIVSGNINITRLTFALAAASCSCAIVCAQGLTPVTVGFSAFCTLLALAAVIDRETLIIPNSLIITALGIRALTLSAGYCLGSVAFESIAASAAGFIGLGAALLAVTLIADYIMGFDTLGGGDIKLIAVAGAYLGIDGGLAALLLACVLALARYRLFTRDGDGRFAFGPAIAAACMILAMGMAVVSAMI